MTAFLVILMMCGEPNFVIFQNLRGQQFAFPWELVEENEAAAFEFQTVLHQLPKGDNGEIMNAMRIPLPMFMGGRCA
jgi:hypothetical protein